MIKVEMLPQDVWDAGKYILKKNLIKNMLIWAVFTGTLYAILIVFARLYFDKAFIWGKSENYALFAWAAVQIFIAISIIVPVVNYCRREIKTNKLIREEKIIGWNDEGLWLMASHVNGRINLKWESLYKWNEDKKLMLIYLSAKECMYIPKRFADPSVWAELRQLLTDHVRKA